MDIVGVGSVKRGDMVTDGIAELIAGAGTDVPESSIGTVGKCSFSGDDGIGGALRMLLDTETTKLDDCNGGKDRKPSLLVSIMQYKYREREKYVLELRDFAFFRTPFP